MYHWSISEPGSLNWRFCIKTSDSIIVENVPITELHLQYRQINSTLFDGSETHIVTARRFGEINLFHPAEDRYMEYSEFMFEENPPVYTMDLHPALRSETVHVFTGIRLRSMNYFGADGGQGWVETEWVFSQSAFFNGNAVFTESPLLQNPLLQEPTDVHVMVGSWNWNKPKTEQKMDWRQFGF